MLERGPDFDARLQGDQTAEPDEARDGGEVRNHGFGEAAPRQLRLHEYVRPKWRWRRVEIQRRKTVGNEEAMQVIEESPRPGRQFH